MTAIMTVIYSHPQTQNELFLQHFQDKKADLTFIFVADSGNFSPSPHLKEDFHALKSHLLTVFFKIWQWIPPLARLSALMQVGCDNHSSASGQHMGFKVPGPDPFLAQPLLSPPRSVPSPARPRMFVTAFSCLSGTWQRSPPSC